jgi:hypothetical protein
LHSIRFYLLQSQTPKIPFDLISSHQFFQPITQTTIEKGEVLKIVARLEAAFSGTAFGSATS